jgi:hypothetical protein
VRFIVFTLGGTEAHSFNDDKLADLDIAVVHIFNGEQIEAARDCLTNG